MHQLLMGRQSVYSFVNYNTNWYYMFPMVVVGALIASAEEFEFQTLSLRLQPAKASQTHYWVEFAIYRQRCFQLLEKF